MAVEKELFGEMPDGSEVYQYFITNDNDYEVSILTLGATLNTIYAKDKDGEWRDILLGFDTVSDYLEKSDYQGATVGPMCNRIGGGSIEIGGIDYKLNTNENGTTSLHSCGELSFRNWDSIITDTDRVEFTTVSEDGANGFPGKTEVKVIFRLDEDNALHISYDAVSDKDTFLNFTNHAYFNLNGYDVSDILSHSVTINADRFTAIDSISIPTGELVPVSGTPFDFREPHTIGERIENDYEQLKLGLGYDHNFCIADYDGKMKLIATAEGDESGIKMEVYSDLPGVQFYTGNFLNGKEGKEEQPMEKRTGFCFETQFFPDTPHNPAFPSCLYKAGDHYTSETVYKFK